MQKYRFLEEHDADSLHHLQAEGLQYTLEHAFNGSQQYRRKLQEVGYELGAVRDLSDLANLPFTNADDLREGYPFPLLSVPESEVVRVHSSSGTTGKRKVLAYSAKDVHTFNMQMARCYELAGLTRQDRVQVCVGYGLWTAGVGFQLGAELFGAMSIPVGPGNLEIQLQLLTDMGTTCLGATSSMALLLGEEVERNNLRDKIALRRVIFGAEPHNSKMRATFEKQLGLEHSFDIAGMTEMYGPGAAMECQAHTGMHYWADLFIHEILDPFTLKPVALGEIGELVVTSLRKEAAPLIRYRTRDLTRFLPGDCPCGLNVPRYDHIIGRSDDMIIFRGVNIYPGQLAEALGHFHEFGSEYQITLSRDEGRDNMLLRVELKEEALVDHRALARALARQIHTSLLISCEVELVAPGTLPRSFGKSKRVIDSRMSA